MGKFSNGLVAVARSVASFKYKWGFIDKEGKLVIRPEYDEATDFSEGLVAVKLDERWGFIDEAGIRVVPITYNYVRPFSEGLAVVQLAGTYGYIDKTGKSISPLQYGSASDFKDGKAQVTNQYGSKTFFIDKTGKEIQ